ncbi:MAG: PAS domain S-box protein, partial [Rubrobacter sp.]|nr:PAS domain S-box protein [Rubrobacter sp.]
MEEREQSLRESQERYRSFVEQSTEGIWRFELENPVPTSVAPEEQVERFYRDGYLAECNDAIARMYGYTHSEEIVGARLEDLFPLSISENVEYLRAFIRYNYQLADAEFQQVHSRGNTKHFLSNLTGIVEDGALVQVWGTQLKITEHKRREEALQISEARFRAMIEQSPLSIQILSPDGRTLQVNRAWEELWGVTLEDIAGYNLLEDQQLVAKDIMPYIQRGFAGEPTSIPTIMYDPDETIPGLSSHEEPKRWVKAFIYPVKDEAGNVHEVILMHEDITERKQAEEVRARLAAIVESSKDAIIGKTLEGKITNWNRGAQNIYGYSTEEVIGKPINILVPSDRPDEIPKILQRLRRGEAINHYETVRITKDGRWLDVSLTISPIKDALGNIIGASTIARDITERKQAEEALRQSELLYHTLIEQATENIFLVDVET